MPDNATKIHFFLQGEDANIEGHVNANGAFTFHNVRPDRYHLLWNIPKGMYVKSIKLGDRLLPDDGIDLTGPPAPLAIQLATDGGRIQGVVRNSAGEPVAGAVVTMNSGTTYDVWTATSDDAGQYAIRDIAPGDYRVLAFDDAPQGAPQDADFRKPYEKSAVPLQVLPSTAAEGGPGGGAGALTPLHFAEQPGPRRAPFAIHGCRGDSHGGRGLFNRQAPEKSQLHNFLRCGSIRARRVSVSSSAIRSNGRSPGTSRASSRERCGAPSPRFEALCARA